MVVLLAWCPGAWGLDTGLDVSQYAHTAWRIRDGFTKGVINSIAQTPDGYLWLGTEFGLLRFDGVRAVPWQPPTGERLPDNYIRSLLVARDGALWIGALKGLASWKDGKLTVYPKLADTTVDALLEDQDGTVWAAGFAVPFGRLCAIEKGNAQCYGEDGSLGQWVECLFQDSQKNIWAATPTGLWRWRPVPPKLFRAPSPILGGHQSLIEDDRGALLISTEAGVRQLLNGKTEAYALPSFGQQVRPSHIFRDRNGALWIGISSGGGLAHVHQGKTDLFSTRNGLSGDTVYTFFEDREGSIWVATRDGLDRFRALAVVTNSVNEGLSSGAAAPVLADRDGSVWIGTPGGLDRWKSGRITTYDGKGGKLNGTYANALFQDSRGQIWAATMNQFGYLENNRFILLREVPTGVVRAITEDAAGNLWIANQSSGLIKLSPQGKVEVSPWERFGHKDFAIALAADPSRGGLWLGFYNGGITYFRDGQVRAAYGTADGLGEGFVGRFRFDDDGTVWVATQGGLSRLKNGRVTTLTSKNGLPCDAVHWVIQDNDHSLWLFMPCGLVRIVRSEIDAWAAVADKNAVDKDKDTHQRVLVTVFDSSDGVRSQGVVAGYTPAVTRSTDGKLWFTTLDGASVIDPHHLPFNKLPPPVHVEQITADRKNYDAASYGNGLVPLPARIRDLEIDYTALSLVVPEKMRFRYKLEGRDSDWQDAGNRRQAFYSDLPPRNYRFRVMACNNSGVWNEAGAFLDFSVAPAYYQTTWFGLSCVAAFLVLLWALYQFRLHQLQQRFNAGLEARVNERTRIARELHDSLLQGFQGLMFRLQAVRDLLPGHGTEAIQALDIALERGDKAIAEGRDTVSDLREPIVGDKDVAQALTALGEELALQSNNGAKPCVRVLVEGKQRDLDPMLRDEVYRIAREALRNAFRHAKAQKIEAEITYADSEFLLHVRDDGLGIAPDVANQGARPGHWGLPGMRERAKSFGGKLEVWSQHGAGTEIALIIPGSIAYGKSSARGRFWFWRKKIEGTNGQQS
jgi:signal transduction histidine kinase/ligand-binding sensor domain-containing protein